MTKETIALLTRLGYCRTSRAHCLVARIDKEDWMLSLPEHMRNNRELIEKGGAQDFYRRVYSKDVLMVGSIAIRHFPGSNWNTTGFVRMSATEQQEIKQQTNRRRPTKK